MDGDGGIERAAVKRRFDGLLLADFLHHSGSSSNPAIEWELTMRTSPQLRPGVFQGALPGATS